MISTQVITNCIEELRSITRVDLAVYAAEGMVVTSTFDTSDISEMLIRNFADSPADSQVIGEISNGDSVVIGAAEEKFKLITFRLDKPKNKLLIGEVEL